MVNEADSDIPGPTAPVEAVAYLQNLLLVSFPRKLTIQKPRKAVSKWS